MNPTASRRSPASNRELYEVTQGSLLQNRREAEGKGKSYAGAASWRRLLHRTSWELLWQRCLFPAHRFHHFLQNSTPSLARLTCQITALAEWSMREIKYTWMEVTRGIYVFTKFAEIWRCLNRGKVERGGTYMTCSSHSFILLCCIFRVKIAWLKIKFTLLTTANYRSWTVFCSAQIFHDPNSARQLNRGRCRL